MGHLRAASSLLLLYLSSGSLRSLCCLPGLWGKAELWCCSRFARAEAAPSAMFLSAVCCQIVGHETPMLRLFVRNGVLLVWETWGLVSVGAVRATNSTVCLQERSVTCGQNHPTETGVGGRFWVLSPAVGLVEGHRLHRRTDNTVRYSHGRA